jgi:oxaloacetate decarboxylase alpha subunit
MESQLKEQNAADKFDQVLEEIPLVRKDLGYIPLVTPTSQIVGTQAVINVLSGERYKTITKETAGVLKGEYGTAPAPVNAELQARVLEGAEPITCRPADLIDPEMDKLIKEVKTKAETDNVALAENIEEDALIYGLFAQVGWKFISNRGNPDAFEPAPDPEAFAQANAPQSKEATEAYTVNVDGRNFQVAIGPGNTDISIQTQAGAASTAVSTASSGELISAPMAGNILNVNVSVGSVVAENDVVIIMEAMKMETEVRTRVAGTITAVNVKAGDAVAVGDTLLTL